MTDIPNVNTGFLPGSGTKNLWIGGTIPYEVRLESGDWRPFVPLGEKQKDPLETMACVTFSDLNILETQAKQQTGIEPNWSDRFIAKLSGTTPQGNYLDKVADTVRNVGLVREEDWPTPPNATWNTYYADIPQDVLSKAMKVTVAYESVAPSDFKKHLKQSPLQVIVTNTNPHHAVALVHIDGTTAYYYDSYYPYLKTTNLSNLYNYALKIVLTMNDHIVIYKNGSEYQLALKAKSEEGFAQQLFDAGAANLLTSDGKPNFPEIDKIAHVL